MVSLIFICIITAYLMGSLPTGYIAGKLAKGIDIREEGSGNVGATNVFRVVGKRAGVVVLIIDVIKGFLAVYLLAALFFNFSGAYSLLVWQITAGIGVIAGHNWTPWLGFKGGKGVATSCGVFLAIIPKAVGLSFFVFIVILLLSNFISFSSMTAALSFPFFVFLTYREHQDFYFLLSMSVMLALLIIFMHRGNIKRLIKGEENKFIKKR